MGATLVMFGADGKRRDFPLKDQIVIIGRNDNCGLRIPLSSVSRQHCQVEQRDDDEYWIRDLGSSNGTLLNDERVVEEELEPGDQLTVGPVKFTVVIDGVPDEIQPDTPPAAASESATDVMSPE
ncbi:MAG: FHA domain-containing protein, partial [Planctomycetota bacterium]